MLALTENDLGFFMFGWTLFTAGLLIGSLKISKAMFLTFPTLTIGFILLDLVFWGHPELKPLAAYDLIVCALYRLVHDVPCDLRWPVRPRRPAGRLAGPLIKRRGDCPSADPRDPTGNVAMALRQDISVEMLNRIGKEHLPGYLGVEIVELTENKLKSRMQVKKLHFAPNNFLHAASIIALAYTSCGYATVADLLDGAQSFTTIELKSNHLGTITEGGIACVAEAAASRQDHASLGCHRQGRSLRPKLAVPLHPDDPVAEK